MVLKLVKGVNNVFSNPFGVLGILQTWIGLSGAVSCFLVVFLTCFNGALYSCLGEILIRGVPKQTKHTDSFHFHG